MAAPNIATLFDFESAYEDALRNYFVNVNVGGFTFPQVLTPRTNLVTANFQQTPRLQIRAGITGLAASGSGVQEELVPLGNTGTSYYSYYTIGLTMDVVTSRSNTSQPHGFYRGAARQGMLEYTASMNNNTVPYYQTVFVNPGSSVQAIDGENDEIITQLSYSIDFHIPPTSWPNG
jgi:hypothetical protein